MEERINEPTEPAGNLPEAAPSPHPPPPPPPHTGKKNRVAHLLKEMWPAYLIEVLVIILGISITLALEEWRDANKERRTELIYLGNLASDISQDIHALRYADSASLTIIHQGNELLTEFYGKENDSMHSRFRTDLMGILERPRFIPHDATFSDLKSSGNMRLLEDLQLKNLLFAYYSLSQNIKEDQDAEQQATISLTGPFFLKHFSMLEDLDDYKQGRRASSTGDWKNSVEFTNNVLLRIGNRGELSLLYEQAEALALKIQGALPTVKDRPLVPF
jgi:hypothetical protein